MYGNHPHGTRNKRDLKRHSRLRWADRTGNGQEMLNGVPVELDLRVKRITVR